MLLSLLERKRCSWLRYLRKVHLSQSNLEYRFYKAYGMEIEDKCAVYGEYTYRLVPREDEPSVYLMHGWIYLSTA